MTRSLFGGVAVSVGTARVLSRGFPSRTRTLAAGFLLAYVAVLVLRPAAWAAIDLAVLTGAVGGILLLERGLHTPGSVAAFLAVAAVVDILSMSGGLSRMLIERYRDGTNDLLLYLTLVVPIRGRAIPIVGIGDLLVGGGGATALLRLGLRPLPIMATLAVGLLSALAYGLWRGGAPALPFLAVAVFVLVRRHAARAARRPGARP